MKREELTRWGNPFSTYQSRGAEAQHAALLLRREAVKDELVRIQQQQLIEARRERRGELRAQVQRLEQQVYQYELMSSSPGKMGPACPGMWPTLTTQMTWPLSPIDHHTPGSNESIIERLVQQNGQLMALLLPKKQYEASSFPDNMTTHTGTESSNSLAPLQRIGDTNPSGRSISGQAIDRRKTSDAIQPESYQGASTKQAVPQFQTPTALPWLPEIEWTDEDEMTLVKLENGEDVVPAISASDLADSNSNTTDGQTSSGPTSALKEQKSRDRIESRKRLEALLNASMKSGSGGALRKPRWRLEAEAESEEVSPFELDDVEAMEPLQIFRSAAITVLCAMHFKKLLLVKKMAEKDSAMRDFEAVLRLYFDATRMWLGKVVRAPLLSLLQDTSLDIDISLNSGIATSSLRGFTIKFGGLLARRPAPPSPANTANSESSVVNPAKLLKLKVRLRGILQALGKAVDKKEVPAGILDFWKRISSDGVYFPPSYQLFSEERQYLEFDALGATRRMNFDDSVSVDLNDSVHKGGVALDKSSTFSRFNVVMINLLLVRILIPHVILQPWNVGIGSKNVGKQVSANLASLGTLLYFVCRQLSPLPSPVEAIESSFFGRRNSRSSNSVQAMNGEVRDSNNDQSPASGGVGAVLSPMETEKHNVDTGFLSIDEIGKRLVLDKNFPCNDIQFIQVVKEHQTLLHDTIRSLRAQLYNSRDQA